MLIKNKCSGLFLMIILVNVTFSEVNLQDINIAKLLQFLKIVKKDKVELNSAGTSCRANLPKQTHDETVSPFRHDEVVPLRLALFKLEAWPLERRHSLVDVGHHQLQIDHHAAVLQPLLDCS